MVQTKNNIQTSSYKHLSFEERQLIEYWHTKGVSNREIGRRLRRHHQTIDNELKRGTTTQIKKNKKVKQLFLLTQDNRTVGKVENVAVVYLS
nr:helix-turn-helix domain-containing protein [Vagococcus elongatus]